MKYAFIRDHQQLWPIGLLCRILQVARSGYYAWTKAALCPGKRQRILPILRQVFWESRRTYGSPRVHRELLAQGHACSLNSVARWMKDAHLQAKRHKKFRIRTTDSSHDGPIAANHLDRQFCQPMANRAWVTDISYVATQEGWLFVAVMLDLFSRKVVGWSMGEGLGVELVTGALAMALDQRQPAKGLLIHSDRGIQYASGAYRDTLQRHALIASMSRRGNCYDNAVMESFFKTLKSELVDHEKYQTRQAARQSIFEYIEVFYNRQRRHSALGYLSPEAFEASR